VADLNIDAALYEENVNCWPLRRDNWVTAATTWSEELRLATFASLRLRGNSCRQQEVQRLMQVEGARAHSQLRRYIRIKSGSRRIFQARVRRSADLQGPQRGDRQAGHS